MPTKHSLTIATRVPRYVADTIREAAAADGISVSAWVSRRLRNNLRRTGRLADTRPPVSEAGVAAD
jgi:predicted HicB family RNase H-like nuclease